MLQQQPATVTHNIVITRELIELFKGFRVRREVDVFTIIIINISQTSSNKKNNICETCAKKCKCGAHYAEKAESGPTKSTFHPFLKKSLVKFSKHRQICRFPLKLKTKNTFLPFEVKPHKPAAFINATLHRWLTRRQSAVCSEQRSKLEKTVKFVRRHGLLKDYFLVIISWELRLIDRKQRYENTQLISAKEGADRMKASLWLWWIISLCGSCFSFCTSEWKSANNFPLQRRKRGGGVQL